ncbi:hypothetical protein HanIR_Chr11g0558521 [Helianthus annuus]|nr:hypothetical protein HanIR_Chr11g0558521 [Helianthus annuus]
MSLSLSWDRELCLLDLEAGIQTTRSQQSLPPSSHLTQCCSSIYHSLLSSFGLPSHSECTLMRVQHQCIFSNVFPKSKDVCL